MRGANCIADMCIGGRYEFSHPYAATSRQRTQDITRIPASYYFLMTLDLEGPQNLFYPPTKRFHVKDTLFFASSIKFCLKKILNVKFMQEFR